MNIGPYVRNADAKAGDGVYRPDVPPLTIAFSHPNTESIDWSSAQKIDPAFINEVKAGIRGNFPRRQEKGSRQIPYPAKDLDTRSLRRDIQVQDQPRRVPGERRIEQIRAGG